MTSAITNELQEEYLGFNKLKHNINRRIKKNK